METLLKTALILFIIKVGIQLILGFVNAVLDTLIYLRK